jgi:hypothetical protein
MVEVGLEASISDTGRQRRGIVPATSARCLGDLRVSAVVDGARSMFAPRHRIVTVPGRLCLNWRYSPAAQLLPRNVSTETDVRISFFLPTRRHKGSSDRPAV